MQHFLDITQLSTDEVFHLLKRAAFFKHATYPLQYRMEYAKFSTINLFYEHSTRTRLSFELAAKKLGMSVLQFDLDQSSLSKGETIEDTMNTLVAMGVDVFVIRHRDDYLPQHLASLCEHAHVINAGDGQHAHPSQALLDLMTILEHKNDLGALKITIVGDVKHSRVANSLQQLFALMGVGELVFVAPDIWWPCDIQFGKATTSLQEGLSKADVVICLRVQKERLTNADHLDLDDYCSHFQVTNACLKQWAKKDAIVMHPGPINRGVEIDDALADGAQSCILQQVHNGVFMRMAIFESLLHA